LECKFSPAKNGKLNKYGEKKEKYWDMDVSYPSVTDRDKWNPFDFEHECPNGAFCLLPVLTNATNTNALWEALCHEDARNLAFDYCGDR